MKSSEETSPAIARWLTIPGRLLLIGTLLGAGALFCAYFLATAPELPSGRYPMLMWIIPLGIAGFLFFRVAAFVLEKIGIRIYTRGSEFTKSPPKS
jgi:uncharacterized membrane protein YgdD (TMEM256/DUF423 family)